jgi:hypothetical protein
MSKDKRYKFYIVLGDWSHDGHGKSEKILIKSNLPVEDVQKAYKKSVKDTGFDFAEEVCSEYNDNSVRDKAFEFFQKYKSPLSEFGLEHARGYPSGEGAITEDNYDDYMFTEDSLVNTLMWFIGLSAGEGWEWEEITDEIPCFNGYWSDIVNNSFGYGLYDD